MKRLKELFTRKPEQSIKHSLPCEITCDWNVHRVQELVVSLRWKGIPVEQVHEPGTNLWRVYTAPEYLMQVRMIQLLLATERNRRKFGRTA